MNIKAICTLTSILGFQPLNIFRLQNVVQSSWWTTKKVIWHVKMCQVTKTLFYLSTMLN